MSALAAFRGDFSINPNSKAIFYESAPAPASSSSFSSDGEEQADDDEVFAETGPLDEPIQENSFDPFTSSLAACVSGSPQNPGSITLLEKLVRSHPIWYLPHLGRIAVMHLLRNKEPGVFIVRHSSQPNSMAVSIKLPSDVCQEVEHYLIETTIAGVHLEGSPNYFAALPILLAHYCEIGDELPLKLTLPMTLMQCELRRDLCSLALLGQDFWSSEHCANEPYVEQKSNTSDNSPSKHRRSMSLSNYPSTSPVNAAKSCSEKRTAEGSTIAAKKTGKSSSTKQRSESVSDAINEKKVFSWRSFFTQNSLGRQASKRKKEDNINAAIDTKEDHCNKSTALWYREFHAHPLMLPAAEQILMNEPTYVEAVSDCNSVIESKSVHSLASIDGDLSTEYDTPTMSRKRLLTFKPGSMAEVNTGSTDIPPPTALCNRRVPNSTSENVLSTCASMGKDVMSMSAQPRKPKPPIKPRTIAPLRREKSDLGWASQQNTDVTSSTDTLNRAITAARNAILPPQSSENRPNAAKFCLDELNKHRTVSAQSSNGSTQSVRCVHSKRDGSPHVVPNNTESKARKIAGLLQMRKAENSSTTASKTLLRPKPLLPSTSAGIHRLSAPNLADANSAEQKTVTEMLKELKFRQQQVVMSTAPLSAGLHTINEGLTPAVKMNASGKKSERRLSQSMEDLTSSVPFIDSEPTKRKSDEVPMVGIVIKPSNTSTSINRVSRSSSCRSSAHADSSISGMQNVSFRTEKKRKDENMFHNETNFQWVAVSKEIKKQKNKVAKVAPVRSNVNSFGSNSSSKKTRSATTTESSDYALLQDCSEMFLGDDYGYGRYGSIGIGNAAADCHPDMEKDDDTKSIISAAGTVFSEPWDSSVWENLLHIVTSMDTSNESSKNGDKPIPDIPKISEAAAKKRNVTVERVQKLKSQNVAPPQTPPLQPLWHEFASHVPLSSNGSTATNSLEKQYSMSSISHPKPPAIRKCSASAVGNEDKFALGPLLSPARFREGKFKFRTSADPCIRIQQCVEKLSKDVTTFFGAQVQYFIKCTIEGQETDPHLVIGNVRQFMNGIKNYLVKNGERNLHSLIEQERSKLNYTEFLNIDAILEGVLQKIILQPLKPHLYHMLVREHSRNGSLQLLSENMKIVRREYADTLGIKTPHCDTAAMEEVRNYFRKMQSQYSPIKKLENLLRAVSLAYCGPSGEPQDETNTDDSKNQAITFAASNLPSADDLLKWFVFLVSRCSLVGCEMEAAYMWGLLHPALLSGEASYYLTAFSSAIHVLKHIDLLSNMRQLDASTSTVSMDYLQMSEMGEGFLKVAIPNEIVGGISYHSFPAVPQMTGSKFCRMIAHKCGITNPEDYGLYLLVDGYETCLLPSECPELVKEQLKMAGKPHMFAYKRHEAKIAWPKVAMSPN